MMAGTHADLIKAADFAARKHAAQTRKGDAGEPYINHLIEVADILAGTPVHHDTALLMAALLHDTIEDTPTTAADIEAEFGHDVTSLVLEVTDDKSLKKQERKQRQIEKAPHKSARARLLKMADKTSNLRSIASSPPAGWDCPRMFEYVVWAEAVVNGCLRAPAGFQADAEAHAAKILNSGFKAAVLEAKTAIAALETS